jgi:hypothetical protein
MFGKTFSRQPARQPIKADTLNQPIAQVEVLGNISFNAPIDATRSASGVNVRLALAGELDARITGGGTGGKYAWRGVAADADNPGTWIDLDADTSGTTSADPLFERNGNTTLPVGTRVLMTRRQGIWVTSYDKCT